MDNISLIKQKLDIIDLVNQYVPLKKSGKSYKGVCPFHGEKTPSFMVSQDLQMFKCFGCGQGGDVFKFIELIEGVDFGSALEILAERAGVTLEHRDYDPQSQLKKRIFEVNELTAKFYHYLLLKHPLGKPGLDYFKIKRNLSDATISNFMLGYAPDSFDSLIKFLTSKGVTSSEMLSAGVVSPRNDGQGIFDKFRGRVIFPLTGTDDKVAGLAGRTIFDKDPKYLNTNDTLVYHKSYFIYALDKARISIKKSGAVLVEGYMDVISAHEAGFTNVVAASGTSLTESQLRLLGRYTNNIIFSFDSDSAGVNAAHRAIEMAEKQGFNISVLVTPSPYKDLDELIKKDITLAAKTFDSAIPVYDFFLLSSLKKFDKQTAVGKKSIAEELVPLFSKITNPVLREHYGKQLAKELSMSEDTVFSMLFSGKATQEDKEVSSRDEKHSLVGISSDSETFLFTLLLKGNLDTVRNFVYKLDTEYFLNPYIKEILEALKEYLQEEPKDFNIKKFSGKLSEISRNLISDLFLYDISDILNDADNESLVKELEVAVQRVKRDSAKRQLKELSERIRLAELEKDTSKVDELTEMFNKLSKNL